ncbi:high nitrogen upregulated cytochrome P450 monooxygenase 2 [Polyporus arcularius HHB13444]|uniref:High nitrogen upregulated cytochrome P450 monooxygenase 2 n=1 Tax=Polyporus arcularius HHB13444 TaxID=1314778 RepID=A0A5C3PHJ1_9APHY|nr:high nitrogen upregulated cytochrome P450 monooxygenase 2 [Polyporus arcularius HHB13444]
MLKRAYSSPGAVSVALALITHQVFRRYETYSWFIHGCLLFGPPTLVATFVSDTADTTRSLLQGFFRALPIHLITLSISVILYRLSPLHPLAGYPGPLSRKVSMLVPAYLSLSGRKCQYSQALHKQYGDVVRTGPNELSIIDTAAMQHLWNLPRGPMNVGISLSDKLVPLMGIQDPAEHARRRRPWNRGMSQAAVKEYEHVFADRVHLLVRRLEEQPGKADLAKWIEYLTYDFMCDMAFGGGSELLREGDKESVFSVMEHGLMVAGALMLVPWLGVYMGYIPGAAKALATLHQTGTRFVLERLERGSTTRDLFHYLNNEDLPDTPPPPRQHLVDDGILAVVAGSDTVSSTATSLIYCLITHPDAYADLKVEVDKYYHPGDDPCNPRHYQDMHYLNAVINETLRIFHPAAAGGQRRVPWDSEPVVAGPYVIPPGTIIMMPQYTIHRDARYFSYPDDFWPERWLIASGDLRLEDARMPPGKPQLARGEFVHNDAAFIPFGHGPIHCVGKALGVLEMRMLTCALVHKFHFQAPQGWDAGTYPEQIKEYVTVTRPPLPVVIKPRW